MNLLLNKLPQTVNIDGKEVSINTNFSTSIMFEELLNNNKLSEEELFYKALELYYPIIPRDINEAIKQMLWFYRCGKEIKYSNGTSNNKDDIYSFDYDADKIYSAFLDQYNIDLQDIEYLHWWKFKALFGALKEDNEISRIMSIRAMDISKLSKEEKSHYLKLKNIYKIPKDVEEVKANDALTEALRRGDLTGIL